MHYQKLRKVTLTVCVLLCIGNKAFADQTESRSMDICIKVATEALDVVLTDSQAIADRCECVRQKRGGKLPTARHAWIKSDKNNPGLELVDCAKTDIVNFYTDATFQASKVRLKTQGVEEKEIRFFSTCVGTGAFNEMRRISRSLLTTKLDKARFREMYNGCEATTK